MDLEKNYKLKEIAEHFNVTVRTIQRHLRLMNISLKVQRRSTNFATLFIQNKNFKTFLLIYFKGTSDSKTPCEMQGNLSGLSNLSLSTESNDQSVLAPLSLFHVGGFFKLSGYCNSD